MKEKIKNEYAVKNGFDDWDDLLCNALPDFVRFAINEVMDIFVNQEVERRIAERMPSGPKRLFQILDEMNLDDTKWALMIRS